MPSTHTLPSTDSAEELRPLVGDDATSTLEDDADFVDSNPGGAGSSENVVEQKAAARSEDGDEETENDVEDEDDEDEEEDEDEDDEDEDEDVDEDDEDIDAPDDDEEEDEDDEDEEDDEDDEDELKAAHSTHTAFHILAQTGNTSLRASAGI